MKKIVTLFAGLLATFALVSPTSANDVTVLATYETEMGTEPITLTVFCETPPKDFVLFTGVVNNTVKDAKMNNTDKAYLVKLDANHDWWANFLNFRMDNPITITEENRYLHILHYREVLNDNWMICLNVDWPLEDKDKGTLRFDSNNKKEKVWEDIVIDLKYLMDNEIPLSKFMFGVSMDWSGPRDNPGGDYFFDEIILSSNPLPRGVNLLEDDEMEFFVGDPASFNKWVASVDTQNAENTYEVVANPFVNQMETLNSSKVMKFEKSANAAWWQGPRFVMPGIMPVGVEGMPSYLHVMVNIPDMEADLDYYVIQLNAKDHAGKQIDSGDMLKYWSDEAGTWVDMVFDVSSLGFLQEFTVRFDVRRNASDELINSPAGTFYLDAFAVNGEEDPRTVVEAPTSVKSATDNGIKVYASGKNIMIDGRASKVTVYDVTGKQLRSVRNIENSAISVSSDGFLFVMTESVDGRIAVSKVIVQ
jgi:hypothetical protein